MAFRIWAAEIFIHNLPLHARDKLLNPDGTIGAAFGNKRRGFEEVFVFTTDSQFVVYAVGDSVDPLLNFFLQDPELFESVHFYKTTEASINHLFATATGLCAEMKGTRRVAELLKMAHFAGLKAGGVGLILDNLVRQSMRVSKKIRAGTAIEKLGEILVDAGMEIVFNQMDSPSELAYLVLGTGEIANSALEFFSQEGFRNVFVASENSTASRDLAERFSVKSIEFDQLDTYIQFSDVVITEESVLHCLSGPISRGELYNDRKKIFLDFGNKFGGNDELKKLPMIHHYTIDDINNSPSANANVFHSLEEAWKMVEAEAQLALNSLQELEHADVLRSRWRTIVQRGEQEISLLRGEVNAHAVESKVLQYYNSRLLRTLENLPSARRSDSFTSDKSLGFVKPGFSKVLGHAASQHFS
jgi:glutamyl-tRNA reductase